MKKLITITAITIVLLSTTKTQAQKAVKFKVIAAKQVVCAGGRTMILADSDITWLKSLNNPAINAALNTHANIQHNSVADVIISALSQRVKIIAGSKLKYADIK